MHLFLMLLKQIQVEFVDRHSTLLAKEVVTELVKYLLAQLFLQRVDLARFIPKQQIRQFQQVMELHLPYALALMLLMWNSFNSIPLFSILVKDHVDNNRSFQKRFVAKVHS